MCTLSTQTLFKLFGPSLPSQQFVGNAILFNAVFVFVFKFVIVFVYVFVFVFRR